MRTPTESPDQRQSIRSAGTNPSSSNTILRWIGGIGIAAGTLFGQPHTTNESRTTLAQQAASADTSPKQASQERTYDDHPDPEKEWQKQEALMRAIVKSGFQQYIESLSAANRERLFYNEGAEAVDECIDEAMQSLRARMMRAIREAGSGILDVESDSSERRKPMDLSFVRDQAKKKIDAKIHVVTSHQECGAARAAYGLQYDLSKEDLAKVPDDVIDAFGAKWSLAVVEEMHNQLRESGEAEEADKVWYEEVAFGKGMERPHHLHIARVLYYDGTDLLDADHPALPKGFVVSREFVGKKGTLNTTDLGLAIAEGLNGFGKKFNDNPDDLAAKFTIVCVGKNSDHTEQLMGEARELLAKLPPKEQARIRIESFVKPGGN